MYPIEIRKLMEIFDPKVDFWEKSRFRMKSLMMAKKYLKITGFMNDFEWHENLLFTVRLVSHFWYFVVLQNPMKIFGFF